MQMCSGQRKVVKLHTVWFSILFFSSLYCDILFKKRRLYSRNFGRLYLWIYWLDRNSLRDRRKAYFSEEFNGIRNLEIGRALFKREPMKRVHSKSALFERLTLFQNGYSDRSAIDSNVFWVRFRKNGMFYRKWWHFLKYNISTLN